MGLEWVVWDKEGIVISPTRADVAHILSSCLDFIKFLIDIGLIMMRERQFLEVVW